MDGEFWGRIRSAAAGICLPAAALFVTACSFGIPGDERTRPEDPVGFIDQIREDIRREAWQSIISSSDPGHYQQRVVGEGIPEVQFVAELFGLLRDDNLIRSRDELAWEDLEQVDSIVVASPGDTIPPVRFSGTAFLDSGETRQVDALVTLVQGRFVLSLPPE